MKRILLLLDHRQNQSLLADELDRDHDVIAGAHDGDLDRDFDLCVIDGSAIDRLWERVRERKRREQPVLLPVLLVTARPDVRMITRRLWQNVDELIITPIEKAELRARVEILFRARSLSLELRRRVEEAEHAARTRDDALAMVSHDLRNPLNLVLTTTALMLQTAQLEARDQERLRMIERGARQMNRLIEDLLEVSAIEAGHARIAPRAEPVEDMMREACGLLEHVAEARQIRLACEIGHTGMVNADRGRILQVFGNLIGNALKFTPEGGTVRVRSEPAARHVRFLVVDSGPGISAADVPHIFDRFWQSQRSHESGAGLGLAIARGIVEAHGGEMWVETEPGAGSTFGFTLPAA